MSSSRPTPLGVRYEVGEREKNKEDERAVHPPPPNHTPSLFFCLLTSLSPRKKKLHLFHSLSIPSRCLQKKSTTEQEPIFLRFSRHHCEADLERETRVMHGEQVLQAIKETEISNKASLFLFLFRWVYFLSKANVKNRTKIRDSMLTWLKRVTAFRSHAKGHAILYDVYYPLANDWSDERFSKSKSLVCGDQSRSTKGLFTGYLA